jgi:hypothetical protein
MDSILCNRIHEGPDAHKTSTISVPVVRLESNLSIIPEVRPLISESFFSTRTRSPTFIDHLIQTTSMPSVVRSFFELYPYSSSISLKRSDYPYTLASRFNNCWLYQITDFHLQSPDVCSEHILYLLRKEYRLVI